VHTVAPLVVLTLQACGGSSAANTAPALYEPRAGWRLRERPPAPAIHGSPHRTCLQRCALPRPALRPPHASIRARRPHLALLCRERGLRPRCRADLANARHPHVLALRARTQAACTRATSAQPLTCSSHAHYARAQRTLLCLQQGGAAPEGRGAGAAGRGAAHARGAGARDCDARWLLARELPRRRRALGAGRAGPGR